MPRTRNQNQQLREDRRAQVLQAAVTEFARNGFAGTSTSDVARAAGVSQATVFVYFATKEDLFRTAVVEPLAPSLQLVEQVLNSAGSPRDRLALLARVMLTSFAQNMSYLRLTQYVAGLRDRFPELAGALMAFSESALGLIAAAIAEGQSAGLCLPGDPRRLARHFNAFIQGCGLMYLNPPDDPIWEDAVSAAVRLICPNTAHPGGENQ